MLNRLITSGLNNQWEPPRLPDGFSLVPASNSHWDTSFVAQASDDSINRAFNALTNIFNSKGEIAIPSGMVGQKPKLSVVGEIYYTEYMGYADWFCGTYEYQASKVWCIAGGCWVGWEIWCDPWAGIAYCGAVYQCDRYWYRTYTRSERYIYKPHYWEYSKDVVSSYSNWAGGAVNHRV